MLIQAKVEGVTLLKQAAALLHTDQLHTRCHSKQTDLRILSNSTLQMFYVEGNTFNAFFTCTERNSACKKGTTGNLNKIK